MEVLSEQLKQRRIDPGFVLVHGQSKSGPHARSLERYRDEKKRRTIWCRALLL